MKILLKIVGSIVLIPIGLFTITWLYFWWNANTTQLWRYPGIIEEHKSWISHFPDRIPPAATNVRFYFCRGFMQGSTMIRLRVTLPAEDFNVLRKQIVEKRPFLRKDEIAHDLLHGVENNDKERELYDVSSLYSSYLISPDIETAKRNWNHPHNSGISFSTTGTEVIYWYN